MDQQMFQPLSCNGQLTSADVDCVPTSPNYAGTLSDLLAAADTAAGEQVVVPCGWCAVASTTDGSTLDLSGGGLNVEGMLHFPPSANLTVVTPHVFVQGVLQMDPPDTDLANTVRVRLVGSDDQYLVPHEENAMACDPAVGCNVGKKAVAVAGGRLDIRGLAEDDACPAWAKLQSVLPPDLEGAQPHEITVPDPRAAECWGSRPNGEILITNSKSSGGWQDQVVRTVQTAEPLVTIQSFDAATKLSFARTDSVLNPISQDGAEDPRMASDVAWLSRPIVFEAVGDGPSDGTYDALHGGHLIILHTPNVAQHIEGAEIRNFGQQGMLGRYPIHFHMSGSVAGSVVRRNVIRESKQRCIVIHGSHDVLVEDNVAFDTYGHCYMLEDGGEHDNTFRNNLGARTRNSGLGIGSSDHEASTPWITNPQNHFVDNVCAGSQSNGAIVDIEILLF